MNTLRKSAAVALSTLLAFIAWPAWPILAAEGDEAPSVESLEVLQDEVVVHTSGDVKYKASVTANPPRVILQLDGAEYHAVSKSYQGKGALLKSVRGGQFAREPKLVARVVLDLARSTPYSIVKTDDGFAVVLGEPKPVTQTAQAQPAAAPSTAPAAAPQSKPVAIKPKAEAPEVASNAKPAKDATRDAPTDKPQKEVGNVSTQVSPDLAQYAEKTSVEGDSQPAAEKKVEPQAAPSAEKRAAHGGDIMSNLPIDPVSLDFDNTDIRDVLRLMGAKARINLIYGPDVSGSLSLHLVDVPFGDAFRTALAMMNLITVQVGDNILRVMPPSGVRASQAAVGLTTKVIALNYQKASDILSSVNQVRTAEGRSGTAVADTKTNSLIITESVEGMMATERLIAQLDVRPKQVLIEAKLIEVNLSNALNLGIQWDYLSVDHADWNHQKGTNLIGTLTTPVGNTASTPPLDRNSSAVNGIGANGRGSGVQLPSDKVFGAFTFGRITNNYFVSATLSAAASNGKVKVLSDPKVATLNNQQATINVQTQFPYVTSNVTSTGVTSNNVQYVSTGITLQVTPTINADGRITLQIQPTVSQPSATAAAAQGGAPGIDTRNANTTVLVRDGETIVIGGLISDSVTDVISKVPLLGDIPILGWLFKKKSVQRVRNELLIFVTPKILD